MTPDQIKAAREALDNMDDYARMNTGVDAFGPRGVLEDFITEVELFRAVTAEDEKPLQRAQRTGEPELYGYALDRANVWVAWPDGNIQWYVLEQPDLPSYCCQTCGEPIGWLGRFFQFLRLPRPFHQCKD